ncbi:hypothetical protein [Rubrobacter aplysinae]|uniref:hypothetical protein n=1 Tax=Rubrobacter aplysinae TaxID=909625 RepID=UPI00128C5C5B|nr:hypothetical protein [Rubrobacter aplysinae]
MYQVTIHFDDGRTPIELLAEDADIELEGGSQDGGLQKCTYTARDGHRAPVYLDPARVAAIVPAPVSASEKTESRSLSSSSETGNSSNRRVFPGSEEPEIVPEGIEIVGGEEEPLEVVNEERRQPGRDLRNRKPTSSRVSTSIPRNRDLEREVLQFLARFIAADVKQLMNRYPIWKNLFAQSNFSLAAERFFDSEDRACDQLELMRREGMIDANVQYFQSDSETVYRITREGEEAAGMSNLPDVSVIDLAHGLDYYKKMVGLYQNMMDSLGGRAEWITGRELMSEEVRAEREEKLGRKLPASSPGAHKAWPATPEGVLFFRDSGAVAAVGLELTHVSKSRLSAYESILDSYCADPNIDRVYLFFAHEKAMQQVEELAQSYRQDDFFVFKEHPSEFPSETNGLLTHRSTKSVRRSWPPK